MHVPRTVNKYAILACFDVNNCAFKVNMHNSTQNSVCTYVQQQQQQCQKQSDRKLCICLAKSAFAVQQQLIIV